MKIGYASVDITPDLGVELSGYGWFLDRKAEGVLDNLYARAVVFENTDETGTMDNSKKSGNSDTGDYAVRKDKNASKSMLMVNCDLIAIKQSITDTIKQQISHKLGIDRTNIMIVCTHTHTGPATGKLIGCGEPDEKYMNSLPKLIVNAAKKAYENLRTVKEAKSVIKAIEPIGYNRVYNSYSPVDNDVRGIAFFFDEGRPLALVSYGCHPVTLGLKKFISADYPGRVVKALNEKGFDGVFLTGFCGDIDPVSNLKKWGAGTSEVIDEYGRRIADAFISNISECETMKNMHLDAFDIEVRLKLQRYSLEDIDRHEEIFGNKKREKPEGYRVQQIWAEDIKTQLKENVEPYLESFTIQVFRIGEVVFAGFPGEIFTALGTIVKKTIPHMNIITLGNANSTMRYVSTRDDIENKGYAGFSSCLLYGRLPLEPGEGERMAQVVAETIKRRI
ncbi:MAG: neutral/alkaline non-lysosomal ceramidase N-terminal domain-containing protein [Firmicutes bacterium]|nr:neutral/alkaline non-lysosomal ceramidase N-terminal domain-containing protein [Bacillota bacterium]